MSNAHFAVIALLFAALSIIFEFMGNMEQADNSMLWAIWCTLSAIYFKTKKEDD